MKKLLKWGCLITLVVVVSLAVMAWRQIGQVRENLEVATPLPIERVQPSPEKVEQIGTQADRAEAERVLRLRDRELTYIAQRALRHPEVRALLEEGRAQGLRALTQVPDPLGFLDGLRLDAVDLAALTTDIRVADHQVHVRGTAPYFDGQKHLNIEISVSGGWAPGAVRVKVHRLFVGTLDVLHLPIYGGFVHDEVDKAVARATRMRTGGPVEDVRVEANAVFVRLRPGGATELGALAREYLR